MGQKKTAIRQNVLDGDNLPNAILNAVIAGYDVDTIVGDTVEVLQQGDTTSFMFEATPDAIEQFADAFVAKVKAVAVELRKFEYIDKPVIRRKGTEAPAKPDARVDGESGTAGQLGKIEGTSAKADVGAGDDEEGMEVESAEAPPAEPPSAEPPSAEPPSAEPPAAAEEETTIRMVSVSDVKIDMILATLEHVGGGRYRGKVAIKFPDSLVGLGASVGAALSRQGVDTDELADAVTDYVISFVARNPDRFGQMDADVATSTLEFIEMAFSRSNDKAIVSTFEVGGEA